MSDTIRAGENSRVEMLKTAELLRSGLMCDQIAKMDEMIEQTAEIDKYNINIFKDILARCESITLSST